MPKDILKIWKRNGYRLTLYYQGSNRLGYRFSDQGKMIFQGEDFKPSPLYAIDSLAAVYGLLSFLSLRPGDTDKEYFKDYTPDQINWCTSIRAEYLALLVSDFEEKKGRKGNR
jgi:hypothetical protein